VEDGNDSDTVLDLETDRLVDEDNEEIVALEIVEIV